MIFRSVENNDGKSLNLVYHIRMVYEQFENCKKILFENILNNSINKIKSLDEDSFSLSNLVQKYNEILEVYKIEKIHTKIIDKPEDSNFIKSYVKKKDIFHVSKKNIEKCNSLFEVVHESPAFNKNSNLEMKESNKKTNLETIAGNMEATISMVNITNNRASSQTNSETDKNNKIINTSINKLSNLKNKFSCTTNSEITLKKVEEKLESPSENRSENKIEPKLITVNTDQSKNIITETDPRQNGLNNDVNAFPQKNMNNIKEQNYSTSSNNNYQPNSFYNNLNGYMLGNLNNNLLGNDLLKSYLSYYNNLKQQTTMPLNTYNPELINYMQNNLFNTLSNTGVNQFFNNHYQNNHIHNNLSNNPSQYNLYNANNLAGMMNNHNNINNSNCQFPHSVINLNNSNYYSNNFYNNFNYSNFPNNFNNQTNYSNLTDVLTKVLIANNLKSNLYGTNINNNYLFQMQEKIPNQQTNQQIVNNNSENLNGDFSSFNLPKTQKLKESVKKESNSESLISFPAEINFTKKKRNMNKENSFGSSQNLLKKTKKINLKKNKKRNRKIHNFSGSSEDDESSESSGILTYEKDANYLGSLKKKTCLKVELDYFKQKYDKELENLHQDPRHKFMNLNFSNMYALENFYLHIKLKLEKRKNNFKADYCANIENIFLSNINDDETTSKDVPKMKKIWSNNSINDKKIEEILFTFEKVWPTQSIPWSQENALEFLMLNKYDEQSTRNLIKSKDKIFTDFIQEKSNNDKKITIENTRTLRRSSRRNNLYSSI